MKYILVLLVCVASGLCYAQLISGNSLNLLWEESDKSNKLIVSYGSGTLPVQATENDRLIFCPDRGKDHLISVVSSEVGSEGLLGKVPSSGDHFISIIDAEGNLIIIANSDSYVGTGYTPWPDDPPCPAPDCGPCPRPTPPFPDPPGGPYLQNY